MSDQVQAIKEKLDIVTIAQEYLGQLRHSGKNYFALCPFHNENTPSFSINQDLQIYKCFGCGESGDVLSLIQKVENVDFVTALEIAGEKAGISVTRNQSPASKKKQKEMRKLYELNELVARYYHHILTKHPRGETARKYVKQRNISNKSVTSFLLGCAPDSFESLKTFLLAKKYSAEELVTYGLLRKKGARFYDVFRNRVIFPIIDHRGQITGFSGRAIDSETQPKYLNSPETPVFKKGELLYGLNAAKDSIRKAKKVIILEGQVDVISSAQIGVMNVVAPLGTALTNEQLSLLSRYAKSVLFCFDNDLAAEKALLRSISLAQRINLAVYSITIPTGKDVDELIQKDKTIWKKVSSQPEHIIDHMLSRLSNRIDTSRVEGKKEVIETMAGLIHSLSSIVDKNVYTQKIAMMLDLDEEIVQRALKEVGTTKKKDNGADIERVLTNSQVHSEEYYIVALILQNSDFAHQIKSHQSAEPFIYSQSLKTLLRINSDKKDVKKEVNDSDVLKKKYTDLMLMDIGTINSKEEFKQAFKWALSQVKKSFYSRNIREIKRALTSESITEKKEQELLKQLNTVSKKIRDLSN